MRIKKILLPIILILALLAGCSASAPQTEQSASPDRESSGSVRQSQADAESSKPPRTDNGQKIESEPETNYVVTFDDGNVIFEQDFNAPTDESKSEITPGKYLPLYTMATFTVYPDSIMRFNNRTRVRLEVIMTDWDINLNAGEMNLLEDVIALYVELPGYYDVHQFVEPVANHNYQILSEKLRFQRKIYVDEQTNQIMHTSWVNTIYTPNKPNTDSGVFLPDTANEWFDYIIETTYRSSVPYTDKRMVVPYNGRITTPAGVFDDVIGVYHENDERITYYAADYGQILVMDWNVGEVVSFLAFILYPQG